MRYCLCLKFALALTGLTLALPLLGKSYSVHTELLSVETTPPAATLAHPDTEETLHAELSAADAELYQSGDSVRATLRKSGKGYFLETLWPAPKLNSAVMEQINSAFLREARLRGKFPFREVGEHMPKFALWDDRAQMLRSEQLHGRYVVMAFIFTRCTVPNMCPLTALKLKELHNLATEAGVADIQLVAVSIDPENDTPGTMRRYLDERDMSTPDYRFLSGSPKVIEALKEQVGVLAEPDERLIVKHTMMLTVFDPTGKIFYRVPGSQWSPEDVLSRIRSHDDG